jgi:Cu/Ag efflux protein CusF
VIHSSFSLATHPRFDSTSSIDFREFIKKNSMKKLIHSGLMGTLAIALIGTPVALRAQTSTNAPTKVKKAAAPKKEKAAPKSIPFHGNIKAIDNTAKTISIGKETIQVTSETKITKANKPATLADGAEGDMVAGSYHKDADGKLNALTVRFGPKVPTESSNTSTNKP